MTPYGPKNSNHMYRVWWHSGDKLDPHLHGVVLDFQMQPSESPAEHYVRLMNQVPPEPTPEKSGQAYTLMIAPADDLHRRLPMIDFCKHWTSSMLRATRLHARSKLPGFPDRDSGSAGTRTTTDLVPS